MAYTEEGRPVWGRLGYEADSLRQLSPEGQEEMDVVLSDAVEVFEPNRDAWLLEELWTSDASGSYSASFSEKGRQLGFFLDEGGTSLSLWPRKGDKMIKPKERGRKRRKVSETYKAAWNFRKSLWQYWNRTGKTVIETVNGGRIEIYTTASGETVSGSGEMGEVAFISSESGRGRPPSLADLPDNVRRCYFAILFDEERRAEKMREEVSGGSYSASSEEEFGEESGNIFFGDFQGSYPRLQDIDPERARRMYETVYSILGKKPRPR